MSKLGRAIRRPHSIMSDTQMGPISLRKRYVTIPPHASSILCSLAVLCGVTTIGSILLG